MANLGLKNGVYLARFRFLGREYKKSLKTSDRRDAEGAMLEVGRTIHRLTVGLIRIPPGVDPGDFIVSGGTLTGAPKADRTVPTLPDAVAEYLANLAHVSESNRMTLAVHLRNLQKKLGSKAAGRLDAVEPRDLELYVQARLRERQPTTVSKERDTLVRFFGWAAASGYVQCSPAASLTKVKGSGDLPPFRTRPEIEALIARGGLGRKEAWSLWDTLYLSPEDIAGVLALVRSRARREVSFLLHALPAYTGMRRGEVMRLRWADVEFDQGSLVARSRKQSRQAAETTRRIDMHPELSSILLAWRDKRPSGQFVACDDDSLDALGRHEAEARFWQPLRGTAWSLPDRSHRLKIGFHTYRHSFASNLAAAGVDQRVIDEFMGHTTEAMRKRYRHLFPKNKKSAIESFSLQPKAGGEA